MLTMAGLLPTGVLDKSLLLRTRQSPVQFLFNTKLAPLHTGQRTTFWFLTELTKVHVPLGFSSEPHFFSGDILGPGAPYPLQGSLAIVTTSS